MANFRLLHFLFAGGIAFCVEYLSFLVGFYILKFPVIIANTLSFISALISSFLLNRQWVFKSQIQTNKWRKQASHYLLLALFNLAVTNVGLYYLATTTVPVYILKFAFVAVIASWNFAIFRNYIFNDIDSENKSK